MAVNVNEVLSLKKLFERIVSNKVKDLKLIGSKELKGM